MASTPGLLQASVGGSVELLVLCGAGAFLSHLGHFNREVCKALSRAIYYVFIPCLVFSSILETVYSVLQSARASEANFNSLQEIWLPPVAGIGIFVVTTSLTLQITWLIARRKKEAVRRTIVVCLLLGNSNAMALLIMQSLCDSFKPIQGSGKCFIQSSGFSSLYNVISTIISWTILFPYLKFAPDSSLDSAEEVENFLPHVDEGVKHVGKATAVSNVHLLQAMGRGLLAPPLLAVAAASIVAIIPGIPRLFLEDSGILRPIQISLNLVGQALVPISSMMVGASLQQSMLQPVLDKNQAYQPEEKFGPFVLICIVLVRLVLFPLIGRFAYRVLHLSGTIRNPVLGIFFLVEWSVPTANKTIVMLNLIADSLPRIGEQLRNDVARCLFWQTITLPIFLTLNTRMALQLQFPPS